MVCITLTEWDLEAQQQERKNAIRSSVSSITSTSEPVLTNTTATGATTTKTKFTLKKIKYSRETLQKLDKLLKSNSISGPYRSQAIRRLIGAKACCICAGIPEVELWRDMNGANLVERYCNKCYYKRKQNELESRELSANYFVKVDSVARFLNPLIFPHPTRP